MHKITSLPPSDRMWIRMDHEHTGELIISIILKTKTPVNTEWAKTCLVPRISKFEKLNNAIYYIDDKPYYMPVEVDPAKQVSEVNTSPEEYQQTLERLCSGTLDKNKPYWHVYVMNTFGQQESTVLFRIHHCYADGRALVKVLNNLFDDQQNSVLEPATNAGPIKDNPNLPFYKGFFARLLIQVKAIIGLMTAPNDNTKTFKRDLTLDKACHVSDAIDVSFLKQASKQLHCTVNDLLVAGLSSAASRYARDHGLDEITAKEVKALVPFDLRSAEEAEFFGNKTGIGLVKLPVQSRSLKEHVLEVRDRMNEIKSGFQPYCGDKVISLIMKLPYKKQKEEMYNFSKKASLILSNVIGPNKPGTIGGVEVSDIYFFLPNFGTIGIGIGVTNYAGKLRITTFTNKAFPNEAKPISDYITEEFSTLIA